VSVPELTRRFAPYIQPGRIVTVPWDKHVAAGTELQIDQLGRTFKRKIIELAAALSDDFDRSESR
jgi:MinD-like ATPase involved in chromosome partitioning or flagellar assembly